MEHEDDFGIVGVTLANAFHVERVVAHGGFAIVYRGIHGGFRAPIALKCLRIPDGMTAAQHNTFLEMFREEGELLFRLSAAIPEVVRPLHIDAVMLPTGQLMPFLALEWLEGEGFDAVIDRTMRERKTGLELLAVVETLRPVAHALTRAHNFPTERGSLCVVHRDLKPENLFLCQVAGVPAIKILDYGIAEVVSAAQKMSDGRSGMNPFTPGYGAPEQWAPDRFGPSGPWTDVWGLAITVTEALLGRPPIDGEVEQMRRIALDPRRRPTPRGVGCSVSNDVEAVFQRAMTLDPKDRTQSLEAFWGELERAAGAAVMAPAGSVKAGPRRRAERELPDAAQEASIDLDLAVAPESLRSPPRAGPASVPPGRGSLPTLPAAQGSSPGKPGGRASLASMPAVRPSQMAMPAVRPEALLDASEADLPTYDQPPLSQPMPSSGPRSVRAPLSARPSTPPASTRHLREEAPASVRASIPADAPLRVGHERPPPSPVSEVAEVIRSRFRTPMILLVVAIGITLVDLASVRLGGEALSLGPIRALWIAGPLAIIGAVLLVWKIVGDD
jgi:serine/threonine protein kinase